MEKTEKTDIAKTFEKIDAHCHTTRRQLENLMHKSASVDEIEKQMAIHNVKKTYLLATYFPHRGSGISNFRLHAWIKNNPKFGMLGSLDFEHYFFQGLNELSELAEMKALSGVKIYTGYQKTDPASEKFRQVVGLAKKNDLPIMMHIGYCHQVFRQYGKMAVENIIKPSDLEKTVKENQDTDFVISHLANPFFEDLMALVRSNENVYSDMGGLINSRTEQEYLPSLIEDVKKYLDECGPKKLLFATDFPVQTHEDSIRIVEKAARRFSRADLENIYCRNAERIFRSENNEDKDNEKAKEGFGKDGFEEINYFGA